MKIAVVSLKFSPGHTEHLCAYYQMFLDMGHEVTLYIAPEYKKFISDLDNVVYINGFKTILADNPDLVFTYNAAIENMLFARYCKKKNVRFVYMLHEPNQKLSDLIVEKKSALKMLGAEVTNSITCHYSDKVLLGSNEGMKEYKARMQIFNKNYALFPLIFRDEYDDKVRYTREYFSFIGGFSAAHACDEFIKFVKYALQNELSIKFLIATRNHIPNILDDGIIKEGMRKGQIVVQEGRPMTESEINGFYRESICVWNAYNRSTQSGVLPNALMQGAPLLVNSKGAAKEVLHDGVESCFVSIPHDNVEIAEKYQYIKAHLEEMSQAARNLFLKQYYYKSNEKLADQIILH
ncbi:hypothetical protein VOI45_01495 [Acidaminococcus fermentans]|uniref:hypothetical protein n=1 Tax=Acidaminococcus fermentans TaxID=905 RepID=UPI002E79EED5|nr:hypothetical protein [Acidaminococcus fermentans]MEE1597467.1 hypothetical protein [Acidaminococcus fermentans]MEE4121730.1 hypothetical protein [Acidaminococcus fermentans]